MTLETIRDNNKHKGPTSSEEYNSKFFKVHKDLAFLFDESNKNEEIIKTNMNINMKEKQFLQSRINELELVIDSLLLEKEQSLNEKGQKELFKSFYDISTIKNNDSERQTNIDPTYGIVSPNIIEENSKFSYKTSTGEIFLPTGLEVNLKESDNITPLDESTNAIVYRDINAIDTNKIVDKNNTTYWLRTIKYPLEESVTEVFGECHIKIPTKTLNNIYANTLYINPFPEGSMTISDIFYKGLGEQWSRLPNFPTTEVKGDEIPSPIKNMKKTIFSFPRTEITEIRIFYSQPYWVENQKEREFTYGFQDIDLSYRLYSEKESEFITTIDLTQYGKNLDYILYPISKAEICSEPYVEDLLEHHLYYDENMISEFEFGETILAPIQKVYIKTIMKREGNRIPILKNLHIKYGEKE